MDYTRCVVAGALTEQGLPALTVDEWLEGKALEATRELDVARRVCGSVFLPRDERGDVLALLTGNTGVGKTFACVAALGETLVEAHQRQKAGTLCVDRPERGRPDMTPERERELARDMLGMDWDSYVATEKLFPGMLSASLRESLAEGAEWNWSAAPLTFVFWSALEVAGGDVFTDEFRRAKERAKSADILIVDDLAAESIGPRSPWPAIVNEIINVRHAEGLPLLITTNAKAAEFRERFGARAVDRMRERGVCLENNGPSRRARRAGGTT